MGIDAVKQVFHVMCVVIGCLYLKLSDVQFLPTTDHMLVIQWHVYTDAHDFDEKALRLVENLRNCAMILLCVFNVVCRGVGRR